MKAKTEEFENVANSNFELQWFELLYQHTHTLTLSAGNNNWY